MDYRSAMYAPRPLLLALSVVVAFVVNWPVAHADKPEHAPEVRTDDIERDRIRDLVRQGKLLPLATLKADILGKWPGELIDVTVDDEHGHIVYEFRILRPAGQMTEVEVDAATGKVIEVENE